MKAMRILMVSEDIPAKGMGGLAKHTLALSRSLRNLGHHVDVMGNNDFPADLITSELPPGGRFFAELKRQFSGWKELQLGIFMPKKRNYIARGFAGAILKRADDYDVIHYHGHLPILANYIPHSINFVQTRHDQGSDCLIHTRYRRGAICNETHPAACANCRTWKPNWIQKKISAFTVKNYRNEVANGFMRHKTIFVSDFLQRNLARTIGAGKWGQTIHNFIESSSTQAARVSEGLILQNQPLRVFIAAKLYRAKGVSDFLDEISPRLPKHIHIDIAGDGEDENMLRERHRHPRIKFHGWQESKITLAMAAHSHVIIVPSVCEEACPTTVLEALMLGKTTFALALGGTPELTIYASAASQLQLFDDMQKLVHALINFQQKPDYLVAPSALADADHAAAALIKIYQKPPGPLNMDCMN
jgi:glycosyltransferase involved in cell wall biosynthesis